jgi:protoporphyrinogen oxidase
VTGPNLDEGAPPRHAGAADAATLTAVDTAHPAPPAGDPAGGSPQVVVIGAGPAGLTATFRLVGRGITSVTVLESDDVVGGISRTVERDGWRFDIGGHRFFTKVRDVEDVWHQVLDGEQFLTRPRMSRIYYGGKFYDYPLKASNALRNLGPVEAVRCVASYMAVRVRPPANKTSFEGWVASRFGWRLYRTFFKTYTEKLWGVPATELQADWAAQRIKNLSLGKAIVKSVVPSKGGDVTSLIEQFEYPRLGPGQMWEVCRDRVVAAGATVTMETKVDKVEHEGGRAVAVQATGPQGTVRLPCDAVISSMPLGHLLAAMDPPPPPDVLAAASGLRHRDFLTVALVVPEEHGFPDNWIYVHSPEVKLGRIQNFRSWSPDMVKPGFTCLGLEYFVNVGDEHWTMTDDELVELGTRELEQIGLVPKGVVKAGYVVRMPGAYPVYDSQYGANVATIRGWLEEHAPNVHPVGRNGMHRYNNQDHSLFTAMLAVENILDGAHHDLWSVNVEEEYHEEATSSSSGSLPAGTGRSAPITA